MYCSCICLQYMMIGPPVLKENDGILTFFNRAANFAANKSGLTKENCFTVSVGLNLKHGF